MPNRFLYSLFIAIDANFRLKNCARSSDDLDPGLHTGLAYFVLNCPYYDHVLQFATQNDVRLRTTVVDALTVTMILDQHMQRFQVHGPC